MEEPSTFHGATSNQPGEVSDSNVSLSRSPINKRRKENVAPSSSMFKGVVNQPNGHWGAQIYANRHRIWLGTFKSEKEAAMAYDSAAIKLRNASTSRNLPWTDITEREPSFQAQFSTEAILAMIKDGSYNSKFSDYQLAQDRQGYRSAALCNKQGFGLRRLFHKELTPSDVSNLNRLVIPKKHALRHFPCNFDVESNGCSVDELVFFEQSMRSWSFRYCYWKSSKSFVFTRGWNRFAKEKGLRSRDRIVFSSYECKDQKMCIIDVEYDGGPRGRPVVQAEASGIEISVPGDGIGEEDLADNGEMNEDDSGENGCVEIKENVANLSCNEEKKGLKLFGVVII